MLTTAKARGFAPRVVAFDSWYGSLQNLKAIRSQGWHWLPQLKSNRQVDLDRTGNQAVRDAPITADGTVVHVKGDGMVKLLRIVAPDGDYEAYEVERLLCVAAPVNSRLSTNISTTIARPGAGSAHISVVTPGY